MEVSCGCVGDSAACEANPQRRDAGATVNAMPGSGGSVRSVVHITAPRGDTPLFSIEAHGQALTGTDEHTRA